MKSCPSYLGTTALTLVLSALAAPAFAQGLETGSISGTVSDETGAVVPGATVTAVNLATEHSRSVVTDERGRYRIAGLTPSRYSLTGELQGFAKVELPELIVNVGVAIDVNLTMKPGTVEETVTVVANAPIVESSKTSLSTIITEQQIQTLPSNGRNYLDFALLTPASVENFSTTGQGTGLNIGGARAKEASLLVDGFYNQDEGFAMPRQRYSQDAIQEFQVISLGGTAEYGRAIGGIVSAVTKSGSNDLNGTAFGFLRDKGLNSQTVLERERGLPKSEFDRQQYGATLGGPIRKDKTFFFLSFERKNQDTPRDNNISAENAAIIGLPPDDAGTIPSYSKNLFMMAKLTHQFSNASTLEASFVQSRWQEYNELFQSFVARSRAVRLNGVDTTWQIKWRYAGKKWLHEINAGYLPRHYWVDAPNLGGPPLVPEGSIAPPNRVPRVLIPGVANFGQLGGHHQRTPTGQLLYSSSTQAGNHILKFGADLAHSRFQVARELQSGAYVFRDLDRFRRGEYSNFSQQFDDPPLNRHHSYISFFAQDTFRASDRLTLNLGLRYDAEIQPKYKGVSFGKDLNNIGPRFGLSYDLTGKGTTYFKLGSGIYYDRLFSNLTDMFFTLKDQPHAINATWLFGQPGAPVYPNFYEGTPADLPAQGASNVWIVPDDLEVPTSGQVVASLEHAFTSDFAVTASFLYNRSWHKEFVFDRNIAFDDATQQWVRLDPNFRVINQYEFSGRAEYIGFTLDVIKRPTKKLAFTGNVTFARAYDTGNNYNTTPTDYRFPDDEWGPTADTPTVRGVASVAYTITPRLQFSTIYRGRSGYAFDPRVGGALDPNGDGNFNDRTLGLGRNSFRGSATHSIDARLAWAMPLGRGELQFLLEGFNLLNRDNVREVFTIYGPVNGQPNALFLEPLSYFAPREVQLGARFTF